MRQQNGRSTVQLDLLGGKFNYRAFGVLAGFGTVVGSFLTNKKRGAAPLFGTIIGAVAQACWMNPTAAMQGGALGSVIGAIGGLLFLVACVALGHVVLRRDPPGRN